MGQSISQVDTFGLAKVGSAVQASSAGFAEAYTSRATELTAAGAAPDWATSAAVTNAAQAWAAFTKSLAAQVDTLGADLSRAATEFRAADQASGDRIAVAGHSPVRIF